MELPLSATTAGEKLLVMIAEAACANAVPAKDALMSTAVRTGRRDDFRFMELLLDRGDRDHCRTFHARATNYFRISAFATQHEHFGRCSRCRSEQCGSKI